nr:hypothetical protein [Microctonus hyperodae filamentous virus]
MFITTEAHNNEQTFIKFEYNYRFTTKQLVKEIFSKTFYYQDEVLMENFKLNLEPTNYSHYLINLNNISIHNLTVIIKALKNIDSATTKCTIMFKLTKNDDNYTNSYSIVSSIKKMLKTTEWSASYYAARNLFIISNSGSSTENIIQLENPAFKCFIKHDNNVNQDIVPAVNASNRYILFNNNNDNISLDMTKSFYGIYNKFTENFIILAISANSSLSCNLLCLGNYDSSFSGGGTENPYLRSRWPRYNDQCFTCEIIWLPPMTYRDIVEFKSCISRHNNEQQILYLFNTDQDSVFKTDVLKLSLDNLTTGTFSLGKQTIVYIMRQNNILKLVEENNSNPLECKLTLSYTLNGSEQKINIFCTDAPKDEKYFGVKADEGTVFITQKTGFVSTKGGVQSKRLKNNFYINDDEHINGAILDDETHNYYLKLGEIYYFHNDHRLCPIVDAADNLTIYLPYPKLWAAAVEKIVTKKTFSSDKDDIILLFWNIEYSLAHMIPIHSLTTQLFDALNLNSQAKFTLLWFSQNSLNHKYYEAEIPNVHFFKMKNFQILPVKLTHVSIASYRCILTIEPKISMPKYHITDVTNTKDNNLVNFFNDSPLKILEKYNGTETNNPEAILTIGSRITDNPTLISSPQQQQLFSIIATETLSIPFNTIRNKSSAASLRIIRLARIRTKNPPPSVPPPPPPPSQQRQQQQQSTSGSRTLS